MTLAKDSNHLSVLVSYYTASVMMLVSIAYTHSKHVELNNTEEYKPALGSPSPSSDLANLNLSESTPDYIIVGGGLSGCVLASRLHEGDPLLHILLIEAGPDSSDHPAMRALDPRGSEIDWSYKTIPQKALNNRQYTFAAGKVLSGGTALNWAAWTRGSKVDYEH